jgi:hypothetical protein
MSLALLMIVALAFTATGCGTGGAKAVVKDFFKAIDDHDVKKFINCFDKDLREDLNDEKEFLKDLLEEIDDMFEDEFGKKWFKELKIGDVEKDDTDDGVTYYTVEIELDGEEEEIAVKKVKGKFYIDEETMSDLAGF